MKLEVNFDVDPITAGREIALKLGPVNSNEVARIWNRTLSKIDDQRTEFVYASEAASNASEKAALLRKISHLERVRRALVDLYYCDDLNAPIEEQDAKPQPPAPAATAEPPASKAAKGTGVVALIETLFDKTDAAFQSVELKFAQVDQRIEELRPK